MPIDPRRLLGFAFAGADLLIEVDGQGVVTLALGAARRVLDEEERGLRGRFIGSLFTPADKPVAESLIAGLEDGARRGPVVLGLAIDPSRAVALNAHRMAGNGGRVSLALSRALIPALETDPRGLMNREGFEDFARGAGEAAGQAGESLEMALIEFAGLDQTCSGLPPAERDLLLSTIAGAVRAKSRTGAAARIDGERFALLRQVGESAELLAQRLSRLAGPVGAPRAKASLIALDSRDAQRIGRAVRFALEDFAQDGLPVAVAPVSLSEAMNRSVQKTLARAGELGVAITERRFQMAYQPVVDLATGQPHHHEALVRFGDGDSPFGFIRLAEEFDLIEELDRAIVEQVADKLRDDPTGKLKLAANVSGRTIVSAGFIEGVLGRLRKDAKLRGRLIFEVTESAAIHDLARAEKHIQALREAGSMVCIDDFGAGAASFAYLQQLTLDIVKIDGRYVRELAGNGRDGAMVRHLVRMCTELKIKTVAEMIETPQIAAKVREAGVDFGQGYLYGHPAEEPLPSPNPQKTAGPAPSGRRRGSVESWG